MRSKSTITINMIAKQILFYILLLTVWQAMYHLCVLTLNIWKPYAFPNPIGVWESFLSLYRQKILFITVFYSLKRAFAGYFISVVIGIIFGIILERFEFFSKTVKPLILGIQTLPSICWVPFAILWFGLDESAIIFVIVMGSTLSIAISVDSAMRSVNPLYIKAAKTMGAKDHEIYYKVIFPASLPSLISGLKQGWSFAWRSLMAGEVMSSSIGLGQALTMGRDLADINRVLLIIIIIIFIGAVIEKFIFSILENKYMVNGG